MKRYKENLIVFGGALVLAALLVGWNVLWLTQPWKNGEKEIGPANIWKYAWWKPRRG